MPDNNDSPPLTVDTSSGNVPLASEKPPPNADHETTPPILKDTGGQTPTKPKESSTAAFKQDNPLMKDRYLLISDETAGQYRVGISPEDFFNAFMPWNEKTSKEYKDAYEDAHLPAELIEKLKQMAGKPEKDMYGIYHEALNPWTQQLKECAPEQTHVINTCLSRSRPADPYTGSASAAVDMGHYDLSEVDEDAMDKTDFSLMQTQVEFKTSATSDPFIDPEIHDDTKSKSGTKSKRGTKSTANAGSGLDVATGASTQSGSPFLDERYPYEKHTVEATEVRGQIAAYAAITLYLSYRTHLFTVGIFGNYCRFIRWDRRGAVVTRRINYTEKPKLLFEFYRRFAQLTRDGRGFDPTVTRIDLGSEVAKRAKEKFAEYRKALIHPQAKKDDEAEEDKQTKKDKSTQPSTSQNPSLFKMTVVFDGVKRSLVFDPAAVKGEQEVFFMKDYWREDSDRTSPEATVYKLLKEKGVTKYVAEMEIGGDINGLRTRWQEPRFGHFSIFSDPSMKAQKPLQVHRIFLKTIAQDLTTFTNARWLVGYVADAMEAALNALIQAHVLHRDISAGNIMIFRPFIPERDNPQGNGILIDWDQCIILSPPMPPPRKTRTGTWQFMSARVLQGDHGSHSYLDDQESAYWVLLYVALRYLQHKLSPERMARNLSELFDDRTREPGGLDVGGEHKIRHLENLTRFTRLHFDIPGLAEMFNELANTFSVVYSKRPSSDDFSFHKTAEWRKLDEAGKKRLSTVDAYITAARKLKNSRWFIDTLREHAPRIPLPKGSCDYHYNPIPNNRLIGGGPRRESHYSSQVSITRIHSLTGEPIADPASTGSKRGTDDTLEVQAKKPKLTLGEG